MKILTSVKLRTIAASILASAMLIIRSYSTGVMLLVKNYMARLKPSARISH